jgi:hypothetical protein
MKKLLLFVVSFVFWAGVFAQSSIKPGVGINFTSITGTGDDITGKLGWQVGGSIEFGEKLYFEPGIFYMTENTEATTVNGGSTTLSEANFKGFRIPVAVGLNVLGNTESAFGLRVFGGGSAFILSSVSDGLVKSDFNSPEWGVFAGVGADLAIFFIDASYQWSVTNVQSNIDDIDFGKTNGFFLTAGLRF